MTHKPPLLSALLCLMPAWCFAGDLSLRFLGPSESPVSGATVEFRLGAATRQPPSAVTDSDGRVKVSVPLPVTVRAQAPGFETLVLKISKTDGGEVVLHMVPAVFHTSVEVMVKEDPASESSVERSALLIDRSGARTVYDAVDRLIPSAYVPSRGVLGHGLGISNSITLRGLGGSPTTQLLVVVDGRPDVMGLMGHPIPDFYSLTDVGSVNVTAGPASVLYGNRAMAGAIEIKPSPAEPGFHTELATSLGSYYTGQDRLSHGGRLGRFHYRVAGGIEHTNGHRENSSFRNQDGTMRLSYDLTPVWRVSADSRYGHFNVEDPGSVQTPAPGRWSRVGRGGYTIAIVNRAEQAWGSMRFFGSHGRHMIHDGFRSVDSNTGFRAQETVSPMRNFEFDLGADFAQYGGRARNISTGLDYGEHEVREGGGFTRARCTVSPKLRLNAGFRYDHNSIFGGVTAGEFGASYHLSADYALSLAVAKGFRNPTIRELYLFPAPTPTLQPERLWNYQATFQLRPVSRLLAWVTGYYSDASNLIVTTGRFPSLKLENIGRSSNRGLEANARLRLARRVNLSSGYAHLSSTNLAPYAPENRLLYSLDVDLQRAFVSLGGSTVGRTWANSARTLRVGGYTAMTLKWMIPAGRHWSFFALVDNLFNRDYEELAGYPMPGTNVAAGAKVKF
ncbi:MAG: TonB-dependent receptor [Acidobacteria bacterium]|nr:TonB-dependent receptor [Acidobacteriota bacterium]